MKTWLQFLTENNKRRSFSSTQINIEGDLKKSIIDTGNKIDPDDVDQTEGLEAEPHVTVLYGLHTSNPNDVKKIVNDYGPIQFTLGKTSLFQTDDYDVLKIEVKSSDLHKLNKMLRNLPFTSTHPKYQPHVTIAYLKSGKGKKYINNNSFEGKVVKSSEIIFSSKNSTKTKIKI